MAVSLEHIVKLIEDSGILAVETLNEFIPPKAFPHDAKDLLQDLVTQKKLSQFQAEAVANGDIQSLVLGNYILIERIGQGGMGAVYKAAHRRMKRVVAIKMLPPTMMKDRAAVERFQREIEAAARLRHPNIVAADDANEANGIHFLVMEYVEGTDLSVLVKQNGPLPTPLAVNYILQAAQGLQAAHAEGIVHRDVKPANLLLSKKGTVKVLDLGLARLDMADSIAYRERLTSTDSIMGTVDYMAPEQALDTKTADTRADIYSLGCSLFYLLAGHAIYAADTPMKTLLAHREQPIPSLRAARPDVPEQLESIFGKMVAKNTEDRYQNIDHVIHDLEQVLQRLNRSVPPATLHPASASLKDDGGPTILMKDQKAELRDPRTKRTGNWRRWGLITAGALGVVTAIAIVFSGPDADEQPDTGSPIANDGTPPGETSDVSKPRWRDWPSDAPLPAIAPFTAEQAKRHQQGWAKYLNIDVEYTNSIGIKFVLIPPGEFTMGSSDAQVEEELRLPPADKHGENCSKSEAPQHRVILTVPIYLGIYEVTQEQYEKVMKQNPSHFAPTGDGKRFVEGQQTSHFPVDNVDWNNAARFCAELSRRETRKPLYEFGDKKVNLVPGSGYRLPTEAEWEFSCRAGTTTNYWNGDSEQDLKKVAWFATNDRGRTHMVGELLANPFGLYDIHGNIWEWVQDEWSEDYYRQFQDQPAIDPIGPLLSRPKSVFRSGRWGRPSVGCYSSSRFSGPPDIAHDFTGFRVALVIDKSGVRN